MYAERFEDFQKTLNKSNEVFSTFKKEMDTVCIRNKYRNVKPGGTTTKQVLLTLAFVNYFLKGRGGIFLFRCNYDLNEYNINSMLITKNFFGGGLILKQNFPQSLQFLNVLYGIIRTLR